MEYEELKNILKEHEKWLCGDASGTKADLARVDLTGADLAGAFLAGALLARVKNIDYPINCPETGEFISFKKLDNGEIATLKIPSRAKRSSATSRKCRASEAFVVSIEKNGKQLKSGKSHRGGEYIVGETIYPDGFDKDRWNECSNGIHFFITRKEAEEY